MPFSRTSRRFLVSAQVHLLAAGGLLALSPWTHASTSGWDGVLWLLVPGFVGFATAGFGLHLFPTVSRRALASGAPDGAAWWLAEAGIVVGSAGKEATLSPLLPSWTFALGAVVYLVSVAVLLGLLSRAMLRSRSLIAGPPPRPGDRPTVPVFVVSWCSALGASVLFAFSGVSPGPGFGWWIAGLHLYLLGHVVLLISVVSLRMVPRSLDADPPRGSAVVLVGLGSLGAVLVPAAMLLAPPSAPWIVSVAAVPEAVFALLFLGLLLLLGVRARRRRPQLGLHVFSVSWLVVGGGLGLWMVRSGEYGLAPVHAIVNVLGFAGLTILFMWFGMVAPFQRTSHAWSQRMLWILSLAWIVGVIVAVATRWDVGAFPAASAAIVGGILSGVAILWAAGTIPVLYPNVGGHADSPGSGATDGPGPA